MRSGIGKSGFVGLISGAALVVAVFGIVGSLRADSFTTVAGSDSDGSLSATLQFTAVNGGIEIIVTNNETTGLGKGQAISAFSFSVANGLGTPSAFTQFSGLTFVPQSGNGPFSWTSASGTAFDDTWNGTGTDSIDHWGFNTSGSTLLATAGNLAPGDNPVYMILPTAGSAGSGKSLQSNGNFNPFVLGPADFFLTIAGVTSNTDLTNDITNVNVSFGTGPDQTLSAPPTPVGSPPGAPLPSAVWGGLALLGMIGLHRKFGAKYA